MILRMMSASLARSSNPKSFIIMPNEDRLQLALQASNEGIWEWKIGNQIIMYSNKVLEFLGYPADQAPNLFLTPEGFIHSDDIEEFRSELQLTLEGEKKIFGIDCRYFHRDQQWRWLRIRGAAIHDEQGNAIRMAGSIIDITRRRNAEFALEEERFRLHTLIENIPVNVYFKDTNSQFVMANTATAEKLGAGSLKHLIGKSDHDFFDSRHADQSLLDEQRIMDTLEKGESTLEKEVWGDNREETWVMTTKRPWLDHNGDVRGTFGVTADVSELVHTQNRLIEVAEQLKNRNSEVEEEMQLAREVQNAVLDNEIPPLPRNGAKMPYRVEFATRYEPVSGMSGDFYEVLPLSDTSVGVLICDVMGHGVRSALIVSMLRGLMEKERSSASSPEIFLQGLNNGLSGILRKAGITMFATAFYAVIDLESEEIRYATAGHPMPLIRDDKGVRLLTSDKKLKGPALGLIPNVNFTSDQLPLNTIKRFLLYTDGIYETENSQGEQMGIQRMADALDSTHAKTLDIGLQILLDSTFAFSQGQGFGDDVCLITFEVHTD